MAKKKIEQLTPTQYAAIRGVTLQAVTDLIRRNRELPGVLEVKKFGRFYLLDVDVNQLKMKEKK
jgi:hypothetical protein